MPSDPQRLPLRTKLFLGLGSMSDGAQLQLVGGVLLLYYNQILKLPAQWVSLALGVSLFVDAFWDPLLGHVSDNLRSRLGRRHPFMYLAALPAGASFMAMWSPPAGLDHAALFGWLLAFVMMFRLSHSFYMVPSSALIPELAPEYHDRTVLIGYRWMLGAMGGAITAFLVYGVFLRKTAAYPLGQLNPAGYPPMALAVGLFIAATILISTLGTHGRIAALHRPPARRIGLIRSVREIAVTLKNRNFLIALLAGMLGATSTALYQGLAVYFSTFMFGLPSSNILVLILTLVVSAPLAFVIAPAASRRWGKRAACMGLFFSSLVFTHGPIVLRLLRAFPENGAPALLPLLVLSSAFSGILSMGGFILSTSMIADIVEENQVQTGRRSEGLLFSADQLLNKVVSGMATVLPGLLLAAVHFPVGVRPDTLDPVIMRNLALIYVPVSVLFSTISIGTWRLYKIGHADHVRNVAVTRAAEMDGPAASPIARMDKDLPLAPKTSARSADASRCGLEKANRASRANSAASL